MTNHNIEEKLDFGKQCSSRIDLDLKLSLCCFIARSEKSEKEVKLNASFAASYFRSLDNSIAPKKPLTWMLVRPPWSSVKSFCLKQAIFDQMNKVCH